MVEQFAPKYSKIAVTVYAFNMSCYGLANTNEFENAHNPFWPKSYTFENGALSYYIDSENGSFRNADAEMPKSWNLHT